MCPLGLRVGALERVSKYRRARPRRSEFFKIGPQIATVVSRSITYGFTTVRRRPRDEAKKGSERCAEKRARANGRGRRAIRDSPRERASGCPSGPLESTKPAMFVASAVARTRGREVP